MIAVGPVMPELGQEVRRRGAGDRDRCRKHPATCSIVLGDAVDGLEHHSQTRPEPSVTTIG